MSVLAVQIVGWVSEGFAGEAVLRVATTRGEARGKITSGANVSIGGCRAHVQHIRTWNSKRFPIDDSTPVLIDLEGDDLHQVEVGIRFPLRFVACRLDVSADGADAYGNPARVCFRLDGGPELDAWFRGQPPTDADTAIRYLGREFRHRIGWSQPMNRSAARYVGLRDPALAAYPTGADLEIQGPA